MTFREAVFAKALDLLEAAFGKGALIAAAHHAVDEFVFEEMNRAVVAEGRHGAAQPIGFVRRELGGVDGDLHRLLLKQRHAQRSFQDIFQFIGRPLRGIGRRIMLGIDPVAAAQIGMHHVALDRPRPHDRNLDDEVVEAPRF